MKLNDYKGILRNSVVLVKKLMENPTDEFAKAMSNGTMHQYLYNVVDTYLKDNGIRADRKSINVLTDCGKEMFLTELVMNERREGNVK